MVEEKLVQCEMCDKKLLFEFLISSRVDEWINRESLSCKIQIIHIDLKRREANLVTRIAHIWKTKEENSNYHKEKCYQHDNKYF